MNTETPETQTVGKVAARVGPLLTIAGGVAAIAGVMLPWAHVTVVRNPVVGSEFAANPTGWSADGPAVVLFGAVAVLIGLALLWRDTGRWGRILRLLVLLCGLGVVGTTFWDVTHAKTRFSAVKRTVEDELRITRVAPHVGVRLSPWIAVSGGGGAALVVAALIDRLIEDEEIVIEDDGSSGTQEPSAG